MKRKRHTEKQIIAILKEHAAGDGRSVPQARISEASFYNWKAIYGPPPVRKLLYFRSLNLVICKRQGEPI